VFLHTRSWSLVTGIKPVILLLYVCVYGEAGTYCDAGQFCSVRTSSWCVHYRLSGRNVECVTHVPLPFVCLDCFICKTCFENYFLCIWRNYKLKNKWSLMLVDGVLKCFNCWSCNKSHHRAGRAAKESRCQHGDLPSVPMKILSMPKSIVFYRKKKKQPKDLAKSEWMRVYMWTFRGLPFCTKFWKWMIRSCAMTFFFLKNGNWEGLNCDWRSAWGPKGKGECITASYYCVSVFYSLN
jgi:hypothetical protein